MKKFFFWIVANIVGLFVIPILHYIYLDRLLNYEYASGIRTSTGGDIILIPVVGMFVFLLLSSLVINFAIACYYFWQRRKRCVSKFP